jgi:A/G-specific adenine glycosylase
MLRVAIVAKRGRKVLLGRLPPSGTFGGLWEPPSLDASGTSIADLRRRFEALTGSRLAHVTALGRVTHILSHRHLEIEVLGATLVRGPTRATKKDGAYEALELVEPRAMARRGLATLARKVLAVAKVE